MSQCVPNWEIEDQPNPSRVLPLKFTSVTANHAAANIGSRTDYEVAELTWIDGHPSMHGLGPFRLGKSMPKCPFSASWGKAIAGRADTLESVVNQATGKILFPSSQLPTASTDYDLVPWISPNQHRNCSSAATGSVSTIAMDALVPCDNRTSGLIDDSSTHVPEPPAGVKGNGCDVAGRKRRRDGNCSVSGIVASLGLPFDTCDINDGGDDLGFTTSTSPIDCSPDTENTSCGRAVTVADEHDSASHSRRSQREGEGEGEGEGKRKAGDFMRSSVSTKRSRAAAVHNQSERKRRDRINQRMKTLQKLVPNSRKTDKASMLDEVIDYLKQLQAQVQMMNRMNSIPHMMMQLQMPMPMPMQQLQMAMMAQMTQMAQIGMEMGMGMGMGMGMDKNMNMNPSLTHPSMQSSTPVTTPPMIQPSAFFPFVNPLWDGSGDRGQSPAAGSVLPIDPFSAFMTCQSQKNPMAMDAFSRMASMYQQLYQQQSQNLNPKQQ